MLLTFSSQYHLTSLTRYYVPVCSSKKEGVQGVDFDWEQPRTREELISYLHLLLEASDALHKADLLISVALHPRQTLHKQVYDVVDRINLMTYDMITSTGPGSHHAKLSDAREAVDALVASGCPSEKILLGIPAYARHVDNAGMVKTYSEIIDGVMEEEKQSSGTTSGTEATFEIIHDMNNYQGYAFDSPAIVEKKVAYARSVGLGGVFFWEIGQDSFKDDLVSGGVLLHAASLAVDIDVESEGAAGQGGVPNKASKKKVHNDGEL